MSREKTEDEIREEFIEYVWDMVNYWDTLAGPKTRKERMAGLVHSILAMLDGCTLCLPGFKMIPYPCEDDKEYHIENGEDWYPDDVDIAGSLYELWYNYEDK